ncbi:MAG: GIDE domain-containing protein [Gammaproteobacteria bacterium]
MNFLARMGQNLATAETKGFLIFGGGMFVFVCVAFYWAFRYMVRARTLEDVPTSKIRSAEQGYVELEGHAELMDGPPVTSPLSRRECVWWSYTIERMSNNSWVRVKSETSESLFLIRDSTGTCIVDPEGADVFPEQMGKWNSKTSSNLTGMGTYTGRNYRYREFYLMPHELLCVIGLHKTHSAIDEWNDADELRRLLADWKKNQVELVNRFDANNDGVLDQDEWEAARAKARKQIALEKRQHAANPGINVIGAPPDRRPFLIAPLSNSDFAKKLRWKSLASLLAGILSGGVLAYVFVLRYSG